MGYMMARIITLALLALAAGAAFGGDTLRLPPFGKQQITPLAYTAELPAPLQWDSSRKLTLGAGGNAVATRLQECPAKPGALRQLLPADVADPRVRKVFWNGISAWKIEALSKQGSQVRLLATRTAGAYLVLSFRGSRQAFQANRGAMLKVARAVRFTAPGLAGDYFIGVDLKQRALSRVDPQLDFDWGSNAATTAIPADRFSARWHGVLTAPRDGEYSFHTITDDGIRLWLDDQLVINNWTDHGPTEDTGTIELKAKTKYKLRLEWYENAGGAVVKLLWTVPGAAKALVGPQHVVCTPRPGITPARIARRQGTTAAGLPFLLGGEIPAGYASALPEGLQWQGRFPRQRLTLGKNNEVEIELRFEELGIPDIPSILPDTAGGAPGSITHIQWKDAPAWRAEYRLGDDDYHEYLVCPLQKGLLVLAVNAASPAVLAKHKATVHRIRRGIRFTDEVMNLSAF